VDRSTMADLKNRSTDWTAWAWKGTSKISISCSRERE
jgi:hypothetical protein